MSSTHASLKLSAKLPPISAPSFMPIIEAAPAKTQPTKGIGERPEPVSYTHLTLPTIYSV